MKPVLILSFLFILKTPAGAQIITTIAGNGAQGVSGDGGNATKAGLWNPNGVAVNDSGDIFIADWGATSIRKITSDGIINTILENSNKGYGSNGGEGLQAITGNLHSITVDHAGNLYFAQFWKSFVYKVSAGAIVSPVAGVGSIGYDGDGKTATDAQLGDPAGVAISASGNVYIADERYSVIRKVSAGGIISTVVGNGTKGYSGDGGAATNAQLNKPSGIAVDDAENLYISDTYNNVIRKVSAGGIISTVAGTGSGGYNAKSNGGSATDAQLSEPAGIAVDNSGNIYIADEYNNMIRKITPDGIINTIAGDGKKDYSGDGGKAVAASLNNPHSVAIDKSGNVYVADMGNHVVRKITQTAQENDIADLPVDEGAVNVSADPANNQLIIKIDKGTYTSFTITDRANKVMIQQKINAIETNIDVSILKQGYYYINLNGTASKTVTFKKDY